MARVKHNNFTIGLSGKFGHFVFRQMKDGRTIVSASPDFSSRVFSKGQRAHQSRFQRAAAYAREASRNNPVYAQRAAGTTKNAYNLALSDWFQAPVIHAVTRQHGSILVVASDNIQVTDVRVTITDAGGQILAQGHASPIEETLWEYETTTEGRVRVEARDFAGNVTSRESE